MRTISLTERQKKICYLLLKNRRKSAYGNLDGNPLSLKHFQDLDNTINETELDELVELGILKQVNYSYSINRENLNKLTEEETIIINNCETDILVVDNLKMSRELKLKKISLSKTLPTMIEKEIILPIETRYDFKNTKISTGLYGVNRIFLPTSSIFPTLVASDTNDYVTTKVITAKNEEDHRKLFINKVYKHENYRRITKEEACLIQGFPKDYILPENRARWMKLVGNSVSVPVIDILAKSIIETGVFNKVSPNTKIRTIPTNIYSEQLTSNQTLKKASL